MQTARAQNRFPQHKGSRITDTRFVRHAGQKSGQRRNRRPDSIVLIAAAGPTLGDSSLQMYLILILILDPYPSNHLETRRVIWGCRGSNNAYTALGVMSSKPTSGRMDFRRQLPSGPSLNQNLGVTTEALLISTGRYGRSSPALVVDQRESGQSSHRNLPFLIAGARFSRIARWSVPSVAGSRSSSQNRLRFRTACPAAYSLES